MDAGEQKENALGDIEDEAADLRHISLPRSARRKIKEDRVKGYAAKVKGYDVINTYVPQTGDTMHPVLWLALLGAALLAGGGLLVLEWLNKKRTA